MDYREYVGKTFGEILADLREKEGDVKLGAVGSSAFYWVDECGKLTDTEVDSLEVSLIGWMKRRVTAAESELLRIINSRPTIEAYVTELAKNEDVEGCGSVADYLEKLTEWIQAVDKQKRVKVRKRKEFAERVPLLQKKVLDAYTSIASWEESTLILLLEGVEQGSYWDKLEAQGKNLDTSKYKENPDEQPDA